MAFDSLRDFITTLEADGDLVRVSKPVSTVHEMTEIQTRLLAERGPAVLFENPVRADGEPSDIPVLVNLFGTVERVARGMGRTAAELRPFGEQLAFLQQPEPPEGLREAIAMLPLIKPVLAMKPRTVSSAPCQEIVLTGDQIDLTKLPIQTCWPGEPAPLITWPLIVTEDKGQTNLGIYRMQVVDRNRTLMRWLKHRGGAAAHARAAETGESLPAAVAIGCDPGTTIAAVAPVPEKISEYEFAGLLRGKKLSLVDCKTVPLKVPASAEIVLEGHVSLTDRAAEGPYGDHTGFYNSVEEFPIFTVSAVTMRKDPIYLSTFTGRPPDEPSTLGEALNDVFVPLFAKQFPEVIDFWLPPDACSYRVAVLSIKKAYPGHARRIMMAVWSYLKQFTYTKFVIVVDHDVDARNWRDVIWAISTHADPVRDTVTVENTPMDYLDFASPYSGLGSKMGIDATTKIPPETRREWGKKIRMDDAVVEKIDGMWDDLGLPGSGRSIW